MISRSEILMGREKLYPLNNELESNLSKLLTAVNIVRAAYGKPLIVSSGYRPGEFNNKAGGAKNSSHITCEAVDFGDKADEFAKWCVNNLSVLEEAGLYMEDPEHTKGWVHLSTRRPPSGTRIFKP